MSDVWAICTFCGRLGDQVNERRINILAENQPDELISIWYMACEACDTRISYVIAATGGTAVSIHALKELSRVMREQPDVDPVEHVLAWERARRVAEARSRIALV